MQSNLWKCVFAWFIVCWALSVVTCIPCATSDISCQEENLRDLSETLDDLGLAHVSRDVLTLRRQVNAKALSGIDDSPILPIREWELKELDQSLEMAEAIGSAVEVQPGFEAVWQVARGQLQQARELVDFLLSRTSFDCDSNGDILMGSNETITDLGEEVNDMKQQLEYCDDGTTFYGAQYFPGDTKDILQDYSAQCEGLTVDEIGNPIIHAVGLNYYGFWSKDPFPNIEVQKKEVFIKDTLSTGWMKKYANYEDFVNGVDAVNIYSHNNKLIGHGQIAYKRSLYFEADMNTIRRYSLVSNNALSKPLAHTGYEYAGNQHTHLDYKADEYGLYVIYTDKTHGKFLIISKIHPLHMNVLDTWYTNKDKTTTCAVFMACGRMYAVNSCVQRLPTHNNKVYVFDTTTNSEHYIDTHINARYGRLGSLSYNPRERVVFGWDNTHMVTYPLRWKNI